MTAAQWRSAVLVLAGLDALVVLGGSDEVRQVSGVQAALLVRGAVAVVSGSLRATRWLRGHPGASSVVLGCASGVASAVGSTLTQTRTLAATAGRTVWSGPMCAVPIAVASLAATGGLIAQVAYGDDLAAPLASHSSSNVLVETLIGSLVLGTAVSGWCVVVLVGSVGVVGLGVVGLIQAPSGPVSCQQTGHAPAGPHRAPAPPPRASAPPPPVV